MYISDFKLLDILREKMGEDEARALVEFIEIKVEDKYIEAKNVFATKEDLLKLELKIVQVIHNNHLEVQKLIADTKIETQKIIAESKNDLQKLMAESKNDLQKLVADSKNDLQKLIADSKFETIKWLFGFILTSTVAIIGTILAVMKMGGW
ncbi:MAG: hypothetical protein NW207_04865 [Cytophagales bacterium]|nr:hypothetical protein [Cytophagales bacterium]